MRCVRASRPQSTTTFASPARIQRCCARVSTTTTAGSFSRRLLDLAVHAACIVLPA